MTNIYKKSQSIPRTARNNRIYPGEYTGGNAPVSNGTGINIDWVSVTPEKVTINRDTHIEGNLTASEEVVAWVAGAVTSDVLAGLTATAPLRKSSASNLVLDYNTSQFEAPGGILQIKAGVLAPSAHSHLISDVTGLQSALDGKEALIAKAAGYAKWTGSAWSFVNEAYSLSSHNHSGTYEPAISAGTTSQYFRGDKTWQTLNTAAVPESGNLYYTQARFDAAFSGKTTSNLTEGTNLYFTNARVKTYADTLYRPIGYVPTWAEVTSKPTWEGKMGWDAANSRVTISTDLHVTGNITASEDVIAYVASAVTSDVLAGLTAAAPLRKSSASNLVLDYNTSQFEAPGGILQIKAGVLAPSAHSHLISDVTGLQAALDSKMVVHSHPYRPDSWVPSWSDVTGKPTTFAPSAHSHLISDVTGLQAALDSKMVVHTHPYRPDSWVPDWADVTGKPSFLALGETATTAYRGDRGKIAYDHSQSSHQSILNGTGFVKVSGTTVSYDNTSYLPLAGGTMSNTNLVTNLNADFLDGLHSSSFTKFAGTMLNVDLNDYFGDRRDIWDYQHANGAVTNHPAGASGYGTLVIEGTPNFTTQIYYSANNEMFFRTKYNPLTSPTWTKVWTDKDFNPSIVNAESLYINYEGNTFRISPRSSVCHLQSYVGGFVFSGMYETAAPVARFTLTNADSLFVNSYKVFNAGNANKSDVDWATKNISVNGTAYFNGNLTAQIATLTGCNTQSLIIKNSSGATKWTISYNTSTDALEFKNASGVLELVLEQSGNLKAKGEVTAYATI